jgi:urease accessory protein
MTAATGSPARSLSGCLCATFVLRGGRTVLASATRTPPLHLQRVLYLDARRPHLCRAVLLNATAGLFAGDRLTVEIHVGVGAAVEVTTPAMSRAYGMPAGHAATVTRISVADGGYLEYLPEPTLACRDAALHTKLEIDAGPNAVVAAGEVLAFGRAARGELHAYRELAASIDLRVAGDAVLVEKLDLDPSSGDVDALTGGFSAYGASHLLGPGAERLLGHVREILAAQPDVIAGASLLPNGAGIAVRVLGRAPSAVQASLRAVHDGFRERCTPAVRDARPCE